MPSLESTALAFGEGATERVRDLQQFLANPKAFTTALVKGLRENYKEIPKQIVEDIKEAGTSPEALAKFIGQNIGGPKLKTKVKSDIVIPEKLMTPLEQALREKGRTHSLERGGWWEGDDRVLRKELQPVAWDLRELTPYHDDLFQRVERAGLPYPEVELRAMPLSVAGSYSPSKKRISGNSALWNALTEGERTSILNHEFQHYLQDIGGLGPEYTGANLLANKRNPYKYYGNPGEIEARIAALRDTSASKTYREVVPFKHNYDLAKRRIARLEEDRWPASFFPEEDTGMLTGELYKP